MMKPLRWLGVALCLDYITVNRTISDGEKLGCWEGVEACRSGGAKAPVFEIE